MVVAAGPCFTGDVYLVLVEAGVEGAEYVGIATHAPAIEI